jgi:hypothetical protein
MYSGWWEADPDDGIQYPADPTTSSTSVTCDSTAYTADSTLITADKV